MLRSFGAKALASQTMLMAGIQLGLSENQWQLDVANWWNTSLAFHQANFVYTALGNSPTPTNLQYLISQPVTDEERHLCESQVC